jgi:ABC-type hemin transport system ATPase subunit
LGRAGADRAAIADLRARLILAPVTTDIETHLELDDVDLSVFEERAEYLSAQQLADWTITTARDREILGKLKGPGLKLLVGPRGSGKSTLLRKAYFELLGDQRVMVAYVNYAKSLALEPLFHRRADALQLFRQWVLLKIVLGLAAACDETGIPTPQRLTELAAEASSFTHALEVGDDPPVQSVRIGPTQLMELLGESMQAAGRSRLVLLLDDAAHAFSPEQQREFFEIFRELRSRQVSAKAAVYPGVTTYSANFHVGHEAELLEAWYRPEDPEFLATMREMAERRLPAGLYAPLEGREELVDFLALASFGLPRGFLSMLSDLLEAAGAGSPTRRMAERAIADHAASVANVFRSLSAKLPRYRLFVESGMQAQGQLASLLQRYNRGKPTTEKAVIVGIRDPLGPELARILSMLEYAGVVRRMDTVSRGTRGVFHRYLIHFAIVINENALSLGRSYGLDVLIQALLTRQAHAFVRTRTVVVLGSDYQERCKLDLAPCQHCGAPRPSEDARFCMRCGRELKNASVYDELLRAPVSRLPLTQNKLDGLQEHTAIRTVQDVLMDAEEGQLRSVPYVGPIWAARIRRYADEFVSV